MSNHDSFIQEVTEEVRRDRLYGIFRRYGWIGLVLVAGIVGGTIWYEVQASRAAARAEGFGDALIEALDTGSPEARRAAMSGIVVDGEQGLLLALMEATDPEEDRAATLAALDRILGDASAGPVWKDLAQLRRVGVLGSELPLAERRAALEPLVELGRPYRALAAEALAALLIEEGKTEDAIAAYGALTTAVDATPALRARAGQIMVALGGKPPEAVPAQGSDAAPGLDLEDATDAG